MDVLLRHAGAGAIVRHRQEYIRRRIGRREREPNRRREDAARAPHMAAAIGCLRSRSSAGRATAQDYPSRTVTIVAPSAPGGMYSILARLIGSKLRAALRKIVRRREPAGRQFDQPARSRSCARRADGYTLMVATSSTMATNVSLHKNLPYHPLTDFIPIVLIARSPEVLLVNAALPVHTIDDLIKLARSTPGGLTFGSAGPEPLSISTARFSNWPWTFRCSTSPTRASNRR